MPITLLCLVKGNTAANAFPIHIDGNSLVGDLKDAIKAKKHKTFHGVEADELKLWKVEIPDDQDDLLSTLTLDDEPELLATRDVEDYWTEKPPKRHIHVIVKLPLLSLEESLSIIPPSVKYPPDTGVSVSTRGLFGIEPTNVKRWDGFLDEVARYRFDQQPRFEKLQFANSLEVRVESNVGTAMEVNIFLVLKQLMGQDYIFSKQKPSDFGQDDPNIGVFIPDYTCRTVASGRIIIALEIKRSIVLEELINDQELSLEDRSVDKAIRQIYNYMASLQLQYGVLTTYDSHWFLYRPKDNPSELQISYHLPLQSESPSVLKSYAYLARLAEGDPKSPHPNIISQVVSQELQQSRQNPQRPITGQGARINSRYNLRNFSSGSSNIPSSSTPRTHKVMKLEEQNFDYSDFNIEGLLGYGQTGGTYRCKFRGETIALKVIDLYKNANFLNKMLKEIEIYGDLTKIQGRCIPKLVCYGYYESRMGYVMGMTIVGTILSRHKISRQQKDMALKALGEIHAHDILHNDIRKENILVGNNGDMYLIDFGMASKVDPKKKRNLFDQETLKLSNLLDRYTVHFARNVGEKISPFITEITV